VAREFVMAIVEPLFYKRKNMKLNSAVINTLL
jgi:hypothetical protein